ncbi:hypothetical protein D3C78_1799450 [compost metagenome]
MPISWVWIRCAFFTDCLDSAMCLAEAVKSPARACCKAINALLRAPPENTSSSMMVLSKSGLISVINSLTLFLLLLRGGSAGGYSLFSLSFLK